MTLFLRMSERYSQGLSTFDPLHGEPLCRLLDPWPGKHREARISWWRYAVFLLTILGPIWGLCWAGDKLWSQDGIIRDVGLYGILLFTIVSLLLIPIARRLLGILVGELVVLGVLDKPITPLDTKAMANGRVLRILEWLSRVEGHRGLILLCTFLLTNCLGFVLILSEGMPRWSLTNLVEGSPLSILHVGHVQPTPAGLWATVLFFPLPAYLICIVARLIVAFACLCSQFAGSASLKIAPTHPDGTGGLQPVGQVALFLSLFTFALGVDIAAMTVNEFLQRSLFHVQDTPGFSNLTVMWLFWTAYLLLGSLLFFLPLVPLRIRMEEAKRRYLLDLAHLKRIAEDQHESELRERTFESGTLQGLVALDQLIHAASQMTVWPFDRKTFTRYAGLLLGPFVPIIADRLPKILDWVREYLHLLH